MRASKERDAARPGARDDKTKRKRSPPTPKPQPADGYLSGPLPGAPEQAAGSFLAANYGLVTDQRNVVDELEVKQVARSPAGYHVTFQQMHQGVAVEGATVSVHMSKDRRVQSTTGRLESAVTGIDVKEMARDGVDEKEALQIAAQAVGSPHDEAKPLQAEQVILPTPKPRLAWKVSLLTSQTTQEWAVWVDALSGQVLRRYDVSMRREVAP